MDLHFRKLTADEIDVRVGQVVCNSNTKGCFVLLYKDARVDMNLLDEATGSPFNWKREHKRDNANCVVSIWDSEKKEWVSKEDTGTESNTEAEKGLASDSFKRACVNWGIGRELYTAPKIFISLADGDFNQKDGKFFIKPSIKFSVKEIGYDEKGCINKLIIVDQRGAVCFTYPKNAVASAPAAKPAPKAKTAKAETKEGNKYDEDYYNILSDIDAADTIAAVKANAALSIGSAYENDVRRKAAKKGIEIAKTLEEIKDAYNIVNGLEGVEDLKSYCVEVAKKKGLYK